MQEFMKEKKRKTSLGDRGSTSGSGRGKEFQGNQKL